MQQEKVIIIGSGPAGLTAALYTARANLNPLVITGNEIGGQVAITYEVENYPGFPEGISGPEIVERFRKQAERFGARVVQDMVEEVDFTTGSPFTLKTQEKTYLAEAVIITTGASPRRLGVPGEADFVGRGVSYCATCDGFFFRGKDVIVVGGGDSALEEGIFLTRFANSVQIVHRRDELRAGQLLQKRAFSNEKISFIWDTVVDEIAGSNSVENVTLRNVKTGETRPLKIDGVFVFIGHIPNSSLFRDQLEMDQRGYVITDLIKQTNIPGVFAAGEIQDPLYRQVATSVGQGCSAGMSAIRWLEEREALVATGELTR
ncbi:MAG: thioredoxin-disulfide reductase [Anaerolineae bacterium]|nr:thioredoxin-disulfide reductase [Anaerolineae bacterium]